MASVACTCAAISCRPISTVALSGSGAGDSSGGATFLLFDEDEAFSAGSFLTLGGGIAGCGARVFLTGGGGTAGCFGVNAEGGVEGVGGSSTPWSMYVPNSKTS